MKGYKRITKEKSTSENTKIVYNEYGYAVLSKELMDMLLQDHNQLWEIENKIENGTLVELPCKVGTTIYHLYKAGNVITEDKVFNYHFEICTKPCVSFENHFWYGTNKRVDTILVEQFGKYWFLTKVEAEAKLKELKEV